MVYLVQQIRGEFNAFRRDVFNSRFEGILTDSQTIDLLRMLYVRSHGYQPHQLASRHMLFESCNTWYEGKDARDCERWIREHQTWGVDWDYYVDD